MRGSRTKDEHKANVIDLKKVNIILLRDKDSYSEDTKYVIRELSAVVNKVQRINQEAFQRNLEIANLCNDRIKEYIESDYLSLKELKDIRDKYLEYNEPKKDEKKRETVEGRNININLRFYILHRDNFTCTYCGRSAPEVVLHIDHMLPFSKGWKTVLENLITSCSDCNLWKKNKYDTSKKR